MTMLARKIYLKWGERVLSVEVYPEKPEAFTQRTGIVLDDKNPAVSQIVDYGLGEKIEQQLGKSMATISPFDDISAIVSKYDIFLSKSDLTNQIKSCHINTGIVSIERLNLEGHLINYLSDNFHSLDEENSFVGFIQIPNEKYTLIYNNNTLSHIAAQNDDGELFVAVHLFKAEREFFDPESEENFIEKPYIVLFYGTDNSSYGKRFVTKEEALQFIKLGYLAGIDQNLDYYNS